MRCENTLRQDEGVAGLTILLSLIVSLFIMGLLVMIFSLMGGEMKNSSTIGASESSSTTQDLVDVQNDVVSLTACAEQPNPVITSITAVNDSVGMEISSGNWTIVTPCGINFTGLDVEFEGVWNVTYAYTFAGSGYKVMNDTVAGIGTSTDWFDIFIVLGAMVVLILLTVIIIISIRGSGMMGGGSSGGNQNIGSA